MSIAGLTYINRTRKSDGEKSDGLGWAPILNCDFTGWATGDVRCAYTIEVYAGLSSWGDGSDWVYKTSKTMPEWRLRNALRSVKAEVLAVKAAIEAAIAAEVGGTAVVDPTPPWLDEPAEPAPSES